MFSVFSGHKDLITQSVKDSVKSNGDPLIRGIQSNQDGNSNKN